MLPFNDITIEWFTGVFGEPTAVQAAAWPCIAAGRDALVSAPTGTGKTLSAFLVFIDRLSGLARRGELRPELYLIYVSPLRSLASDIRENLRKPLDGISHCERERGENVGSGGGGRGAVREAVRGAAREASASALAKLAVSEGTAAASAVEMPGCLMAFRAQMTFQGRRKLPLASVLATRRRPTGVLCSSIRRTY
ncbi:MAG: DEAD/DEAH box helicase [Oscillospiraceae bacterium]|nr:DEAD/DEAH box helicase [Oscillospiraceae bacterium]